MSNGYWQIDRQKVPFDSGRNLTERLRTYVSTWQSRCYEAGIPDEVPEKLAKINRAPSYKAMAIAILKNDHNLLSLGFRQRKSVMAESLYRQSRRGPQTELL